MASAQVVEAARSPLPQAGTLHKGEELALAEEELVEVLLAVLFPAETIAPLLVLTTLVASNALKRSGGPKAQPSTP